jgi:hypothetical protein
MLLQGVILLVAMTVHTFLECMALGLMVRADRVEVSCWLDPHYCAQSICLLRHGPSLCTREAPEQTNARPLSCQRLLAGTGCCMLHPGVSPGAAPGALILLLAGVGHRLTVALVQPPWVANLTTAS